MPFKQGPIWPPTGNTEDVLRDALPQFYAGFQTICRLGGWWLQWVLSTIPALACLAEGGEVVKVGMAEEGKHHRTWAFTTQPSPEREYSTSISYLTNY